MANTSNKKLRAESKEKNRKMRVGIKESKQDAEKTFGKQPYFKTHLNNRREKL